MKGISYALFGFDEPTPNNCFDFSCYLRGLHINVRFNRIIFPGWDNIINIDEKTYHSKFQPIFDWHRDRGFITINICENDGELTEKMLWRLKPVFHYTHPEWIYTHVICRDLDSISTYREAQMVQEWINEDKTIHCITDSVSHNIPMLGGMVGFKPAHFHSRMGLTGVNDEPWNGLVSKGHFDFSRKGEDQTFLNQIVYPKCAESSTEHFIKGMPHNLKEENGRHYSVNDSIDIGVDPKYKETNLFCGHAGSAGYYEAPTMKFLHYDDPYREEYKDLESRKEFQNIFYWG